ncbi:protein adenylyltransferase SelO [Zavarzinella formosa]|uniref:protein adenylyltransferase SelO n=1 Tax=Zavarzinella formosa TaxID=360055 RepID=UPI0002D8D488|nr:YdiU family protein [Zavarzinella formosa]
MKTLETLSFDNTYAALPETFRQRVSPTVVPSPYLIAFNADAAKLIDLDPEEAKRPEFAEYFAGNKLLPGSDPVAMKYAGHQFGHYVPQLGDGRAILLGEVRNSIGGKWDLHLKGGGQTAFSRMGDGRAVLRSSIREYLCGEAMHALNVPTTRALCLVGTDMEVYREHQETGALVTRMAPSHVRFGSFEVFAHRGQTDEVKTLADYVIGLYFPHLVAAEKPYLAFYREVISRTAELMAHWQAIGFAHGVMNTDNMSILGLTLDYGPFGFMEDFDPGFICNHSDDTGRYAFDQQPRIGYWNLACLGYALMSLIDADDARAAIETYAPAFNAKMNSLMMAKIGLQTSCDGDLKLWQDLIDLLAVAKTDYTNYFRILGNFDSSPDARNDGIRQRLKLAPMADEWFNRYSARLREESRTDADRREAMNQVNPRYVLRNYLAQVAIEKAERKDFGEIERLMSVLKHPFDDQPEMAHYANPAPAWARGLHVSCSS